MKNTIIGIIIVVAMSIASVTTGVITKKAVKKTEKENCAEKNEIVIRMYDKLFDAHEKLASTAKYLISQTLTVKKVKNGQIIYIPTSTMTIDSIIHDLNVKISKLPVDFTSLNDTIKTEETKTFWDKVKDLFK